MSSIFGSLSATQQQQPQKPTLSLFGGTQTAQPQATTSLFGGLGQSQSQPAATSLFGGAAQATQQPASTSLFGGLGAAQNQQAQQQQAQQAQQQSQTQLGGSLFGASVQKPAQSLFGQSAVQPAAGSSLFGASQHAIAPLPALSKASEWRSQSVSVRDKPIQDQIEVLAKKWSPEFPECVFQTYVYNAATEAELPFYAPAQGEDEQKWEEALQKRPVPNSVPVLARGFESLGYRLRNQHQAAELLRSRLHDIDKCISARLATHDTNTTSRTRQARQRHQALSRRCLALAAKAQVLRNRGYALDRTEEELRKKLVDLEKQVFDPVLHGREEEIWARLAVVREKIDQITIESKALGDKAVSEADSELLSEKEKSTVRKILHDYDSQLEHLTKEIAAILKDFEEWETMTAGSAR